MEPAPVEGTLVVFGGSFNPPHNAHVALAQAALDAVEDGRVIWVPAATPPHKQDDPELVSPEHRLAMTALATMGNDDFLVSDIEIRRGGVSYTIDTLRSLQKSQPGARLALLLGSDTLADLPTWREPEAIVKTAHLLVYRRPNTGERPIPDRLKTRVQFLASAPIELSSTQLRRQLAAGLDVSTWIPGSVLEYIIRHGLYGVAAKG